mmetsp:Transcript_64100/g.133669  ORF Transcript_64100/g.133669 Transcript_64100/m.133669 type:complete len:159 (-) Transcript_64100:423-899(-)
MDGRLAMYDTVERQVEAMKQQWKHLKAWATRGKIEFPFPRQPDGKSFVAWNAGLKRLLTHEKTAPIIQYKDRCQQAGSLEDVTIVKNIKEKHVDAADPAQLQQWMKEALDAADEDVHRSRKHRRDKEAAAAERGEQREIPQAQSPDFQQGPAEKCFVA